MQHDTVTEFMKAVLKHAQVKGFVRGEDLEYWLDLLGGVHEHSNRM